VIACWNALDQHIVDAPIVSMPSGKGRLDKLKHTQKGFYDNLLSPRPHRTTGSLVRPRKVRYMYKVRSNSKYQYIDQTKLGNRDVSLLGLPTTYAIDVGASSKLLL